MDGAKTTIPTTTLRRDALGRVWTPRAAREAILDEFERSGLSAARFARAAGIKYQTFVTWVQGRRHAHGDYERRPLCEPAAIRLVEVVAQAAPAAVDVSCSSLSGTDISALEVLLPGGARLLVRDVRQENGVRVQLLDKIPSMRLTRSAAPTWAGEWAGCCTRSGAARRSTT